MRSEDNCQVVSGRPVAPAYHHGNIQRAVTAGAASQATAEAGTSIVVTLLPIMAVVLLDFFVIGIALPVLPLHVHDGLGLGAFMVGLVAGSQFAASLLSRLWAGYFADNRGVKRAVVTGLLLAATAGLFYLLSLRFLDKPGTSVAILFVGRALLGASESFVITGALSWGLMIGGPQNAGRVMAWMGTGILAAFAAGAPAGAALYEGYGFAAIALATLLIPLATLLLVAPLRPVAPLPNARPLFIKVVGAVWVPGLGLAFSCVGFGAITTFIALVFSTNGWSYGWLAFTALSIAFILGRVVFGHLPDRIGGAKVALVCVLIEAAGQAMIWLAPWPAAALIGCALTGLGYSLIYPGFGVEAVHSVPAENRGLALGAYTAFLDLALGTANPLLGLVATHAGFDSVFLVSTVVVMFSAFIAVGLLYARREVAKPSLQ